MIIVVMILKEPWAKAMAVFGFIPSSLSIVLTYIVKGIRKIVKITVPTALNVTWAAASLLAVVVEPITAIIAVIVVPILSPNSTGRAAWRVTSPSLYIL